MLWAGWVKKKKSGMALRWHSRFLLLTEHSIEYFSATAGGGSMRGGAIETADDGRACGALVRSCDVIGTLERGGDGVAALARKGTFPLALVARCIVVEEAHRFTIELTDGSAFRVRCRRHARVVVAPSAERASRSRSAESARTRRGVGIKEKGAFFFVPSILSSPPTPPVLPTARPLRC